MPPAGAVVARESPQPNTLRVTIVTLIKVKVKERHDRPFIL
jgi:hypothetical protein